jgi:hypothetical protein
MAVLQTGKKVSQPTLYAAFFRHPALLSSDEILIFKIAPSKKLRL